MGKGHGCHIRNCYKDLKGNYYYYYFVKKKDKKNTNTKIKIKRGRPKRLEPGKAGFHFAFMRTSLIHRRKPSEPDSLLCFFCLSLLLHLSPRTFPYDKT